MTIGGGSSGPKEDASEVSFIVVDDEEQLRSTISRALKFGGFNVISDFRNGAEAWKFIKGYRGRIDILLTDVEMPEMDGIELVKQIRSEGLDIRKIIFMSAGNDNGINSLESAEKFGGQGYIQKPILSIPDFQKYMFQIASEGGGSDQE